MTRKFAFLLAPFCGLLAATAGAADLMAQAQALFKPIPQEPPSIEGNPASPARVELGKMLFFDARLSAGHNINCNTCHRLSLGGVDMLETSIGHKWQQGPRNSPTVLNAVFNTAQFWDGRAEDLREQAGGPLANPIEMGASPKHVVKMLKSIPGYRPAFEAAFPDIEDPITFDNALKAIEVFEATLITPNAPFDRYLRGDAEALDAEQREGLKLFVQKGCAGCHNGVNLGGNRYAAFGVVEQPGAELLPPDDKGRFEVTNAVSDEYVFKVPTLRNVADTPPYFHSGKSWDLRQAVAVMGSAQLGIEMTDEEIDRITAFLRSLSGERPAVTYPVLPTSSVDTPRPRP